MYSKDTGACPYNEMLSNIKRNEAAPDLRTKHDLQDILNGKEKRKFQYCMYNTLQSVYTCNHTYMSVHIHTYTHIHECAYITHTHYVQAKRCLGHHPH